MIGQRLRQAQEQTPLAPEVGEDSRLAGHSVTPADGRDVVHALRDAPVEAAEEFSRGVQVVGRVVRRSGGRYAASSLRAIAAAIRTGCPSPFELGIAAAYVALADSMDGR